MANNLSIVNPDGSKTAVTREQLVVLVQSGKLTSDSKIEVLGRVVSVGKVRELRQYLTPNEAVEPESTPPIAQTQDTAQLNNHVEKLAPNPADCSNSGHSPVFAPVAAEKSPSQSVETDLYDIIPPIPTPQENPTFQTSQPFQASLTPTSFTQNANPASIKSFVKPLIPVALDNGQEVSSIINTKRVKQITKERLGVIWYIYWIIIGISCVGVVGSGLRRIVLSISYFWDSNISFGLAFKLFGMDFLILLLSILVAFVDYLLARWLYDFFTMIFVDNPIRREMYQVEQIRMQQELVDALKSKTA